MRKRGQASFRSDHLWLLQKYVSFSGEFSWEFDALCKITSFLKTIVNSQSDSAITRSPLFASSAAHYPLRNPIRRRGPLTAIWRKATRLDAVFITLCCHRSSFSALAVAARGAVVVCLLSGSAFFLVREVKTPSQSGFFRLLLKNPLPFEAVRSEPKYRRAALCKEEKSSLH